MAAAGLLAGIIMAYVWHFRVTATQTKNVILFDQINKYLNKKIMVGSITKFVHKKRKERRL